MTDAITYEPLKGIRAVRVDGAEELLRQGEYYTTSSPGFKTIIIICPCCRVTLMVPKGIKIRTANLVERFLGIRKGLTIGRPILCYLCGNSFKVIESEILISQNGTKTA